MSEPKQAEFSDTSSEQSFSDFATLMAESPSPILRMARDGRILACNFAARRALALQRSGNHDQKVPDALVEQALEGVCQSKKRQTVELRVGEKVFSLDVVPFSDKGYVNVYASDITEMRYIQSELHTQALKDTLTGIGNRRFLMGQLELAMARYAHEGVLFAVHFLDLDHFKYVNDSLGHQSGDQLLLQAARRLNEIASDTDFIARLDGDEFVVLQNNVNGRDDAEAMAGQIRAHFQNPFTVMDHDLKITTSIGVAMPNSPDESASSVLERSDLALSEAKAKRGVYVLHTDEITEKAEYISTVARELFFAVDRQEFSLVYQPQINLNDPGKICCEALIRWTSGKLGWVGPGDFIPIAESHGHMIKVGYWVLRTACRQLKAWIEADVPIDKLAINVATPQLQEPGFAVTCLDILSEHGISADRIELEITESAHIGADETITANIQLLSYSGITLAVDDFGTGYSSLTYLIHLPITRLKVAQELVRSIFENKSNLAIVEATLAMAKKLQMETVAEGVETQDIVDLLKSFGCDFIQGYFYARPLDPEALAAFAQEYAQKNGAR